MEWKLPPKAKIYEALSCIGSGRVEFVGPDQALVSSSEENRKYRVTFDLGANRIKSNDNGSKWQGYLGYPSIAVLMLKGKIPFEQDFGEALKDIKWHTLNKMFKHQYDLAIKKAQQIAAERGCDIAKLEEFVDKVMDEIKSKRFQRLGATLRR